MEVQLFFVVFLSGSLLKEVKGCPYTLVDMTHTLKENIPKYPVHDALEREVTQHGNPSKNYWYQAEWIKLSTHLGTHVDAPCHFWNGGWCIEDIPIERLTTRPAAVLDIRHKVFFANNGSVNADAQVTVDDLLDWEIAHGAFPDGGVLLVNSGWDRYWPDINKFLGSDNITDLTSLHFPGVHPSAAEWLVQNRKLYGVGSDAISIDYGQSDDFAAHVTFVKANMFIIENAKNIDKLPPTGAIVNIGALKLGRNASGSPIRLVATVGISSMQKASSTTPEPAAIILGEDDTTAELTHKTML